MPDFSIERRIRWAASLVGLGVAIQLASLHWNHPLSFMAFIVVGSPLVAAGVLLYLYSLASRGDGAVAEAARSAAKGKGQAR